MRRESGRQMQLVTVGSTNPVKIGAARQVFDLLVGDCVVSGIKVPSGVPEQPIGEEETIAGALTRARNVLASTDAHWGVGLEGGVAFVGEACWMIQFCAVIHRDGRSSIGKGPQFLLPPVIATGVRNGGEVGPLMDKLTGEHNIKQKGGAVGFLTRGFVLRETMYAHMVSAALIPFLHHELY
jgi:inosine/xanthosine triphosphatase